MAHEETADLLRSARAKILRNSIFRRKKQLKSNFAKILTESYPARGWPHKQAVVYTSDIKREWFGATEGRDKPSWLAGPALRDIGHAPSQRFAAIPIDAMPLPCRSCCVRMSAPRRHHLRQSASSSSVQIPSADRSAISDEAVRAGHRIRAFANRPASPWRSEALVSAGHNTMGKRATRAIGVGHLGGNKPIGITRRRFGASHERNAVEPDIPILILRNEMRFLRYGRRHEEMIEGIRRRAWFQSFTSSFNHRNKACVSRSCLTPRIP
jgi:hypothetical protein